ncbi:hypothetical protein HK104_010264 [Borealophlyctis nickersoniae]|nr:hypothetical protein HK104_010264 [Borealophlyctis nickersoniae]
MFPFDTLRAIYKYLVEDSVKAHKIGLLKASYTGLEERLLANYPREDVVQAILSCRLIGDLVAGIQSRRYKVLKCRRDLVKLIFSDRWTAEDLMRVHCLRSLRIHREYNCITEQFMDDAIRAAINLDARFRVTQELKGGPLHGIPIAIKDDIDVKGYDSTLGCKCRCMQPKYMDAPMVTALRAAGGIIFCKTNVSWHDLSADCSNTLFGQTVNPLNKRLSPGGSSGGVAALIAAGGVVVGCGSDCSGGLRIPAQHCGLYTLKPTSGRLPGAPTHNTLGWDTIPAVLGPLSQSPEDLATFCESILQTEPWRWDPMVAPISFDQPLYRSIVTTRRLKVGYYVHDGFFRAAPPAAHAVHEVVEALRMQGHEAVEFRPPNVVQALLLMAKLLLIDLSSPCTRLREFQDDNIVEPLFPFIMLMQLPKVLRNLVALFFERVMEDKITGAMLRTFGLGGMSASRKAGRSPKETVELWAEKDDYQRLFAEMWNDMKGMDVIVHAIPPTPSDSLPYICAGASYSILYNLLDYPVGVVPNVTTVKLEDKVADPVQYVHSADVPGGGVPHVPAQQQQQPPQVQQQPQPRTPRKGSFNFLGILGMEEYNTRIAEGVMTKGATVGVQVVGRRFEEEKVLAAMLVIRNALEASRRRMS